MMFERLVDHLACHGDDVAVITAENIKAEIFDAGVTPVADVCTADYAEACAALGIE